MSTNSAEFHFSTEGKQSCRDYVVTQFRARSLNISPDGMLIGKWLEPVGHRAATFKALLAYDPPVVHESQLVGVDRHPDTPEKSRENLDICSQLFPLAQFHWEDWESFCSRYERSDIKYIFYDLYTSTLGVSLEANLDAIRGLVLHSLNHSQGQVLVALNADLTAMRRHKDTEQAYRDRLVSMFRSREFITSDILNEPIFRYRSTARGDEMGVMVVEFYRTL